MNQYMLELFKDYLTRSHPDGVLPLTVKDGKFTHQGVHDQWLAFQEGFRHGQTYEKNTAFKITDIHINRINEKIAKKIAKVIKKELNHG